MYAMAAEHAVDDSGFIAMGGLHSGRLRELRKLEIFVTLRKQGSSN